MFGLVFVCCLLCLFFLACFFSCFVLFDLFFVFSCDFSFDLVSCFCFIYSILFVFCYFLPRTLRGPSRYLFGNCIPKSTSIISTGLLRTEKLHQREPSSFVTKNATPKMFGSLQ